MIRAKGGQSAPQVELLQPSVFLFLLLDVFPDHLLVTSDRGYKVPSGPEVLPYEVPLLFPVYPGQVDRTLALDEPDHLRHRVFRRDSCAWRLTIRSFIGGHPRKRQTFAAPRQSRGNSHVGLAVDIAVASWRDRTRNAACARTDGRKVTPCGRHAACFFLPGFAGGKFNDTR